MFNGSEMASGDTYPRLLNSSAYFRICVLAGPSMVGVNRLREPCTRTAQSSRVGYSQ